MSKMKWLSIAVIGLLAVNLVMVTTLLMKKPIPLLPPPPHGEGMHRQPKEIIIERLKFDEKQKAVYEEAIAKHRQSIGELEQQIMELKNKLYATLSAESMQPQKDSLEIQLLDVQKQIEDVNYNHFLYIKKICLPQQLPLYNELSTEFAGFFMPPEQPRHPPQK
jgi:periplasmic protein CpxP/Spy